MMDFNDSNGFSLLELTVAILIMAVLAGLSYPSVKAWLDNAAYREAANDVVTQLRTARDRAIGNSSTTTESLAMGALSNGVVLKSGADCDVTSTLAVTFSPDGSVTWSPNGNDDDAGKVCIIDRSGTTRFKVKLVSKTTGRIVVYPGSSSE